MNMAARALERVGDNAVDIAEQVGFLLTGRVPRVHRCVPSGDDRMSSMPDGDRPHGRSSEPEPPRTS